MAERYSSFSTLSSSTVSELDSLPGLESAKRLVLGLASGSAVQAVLFYGMEGCGKRRLAEILTKSWLCSKPAQIGDGLAGACGGCQACLAFERGRSADVLWLEPKGPSRIIKLSAIVPLKGKDVEDDDFPVSAQHFLRTPPLSARNKVVVIEDADRLNPRAGNSLLKTLEEPPPFGRFILLTESVGSLLPTILSRCLAVACEVPKDIAGFEPWALRLAAGAPGRASELQEFSTEYRPLYDFALGLSSRPVSEALVAAEEFSRMADALQAARKLNARAADAEALGVLASAYLLSPSADPIALQYMIETHRRILGNANSMSALDALFAAVLGR